MGEYDPGPPQPFLDIFDRLPDYAPFREHFWFDWGPVLYRGRLDGTARVLCVASDPGPTERIAGRTLVGDAGQRVQGFLAKVGLSRSYLCLNALSYALFPSHGSKAPAIIADPTLTAWRNELFDAARGPELRAVVAFGRLAQRAVDRWPGRAGLTVIEVPHPSSRDQTRLLDAWRSAVVALREVVDPDPDGDPSGPPYGSSLEPDDWAPIPRRDLPYGVPEWLGDDSWLRARPGPRRYSSVTRPVPDDRRTLIWIAPET
jgi:hypothetical protein